MKNVATRLGPMGVALSGALLMGALDWATAWGAAKRAGAPVASLGAQIGLLLLLVGAALGAVQWLAIVTTERLVARYALRPRGRAIVYGAWLSAVPSILWLTLLSQRWSAIGITARALLIAGLAAAQVIAYGSARVVLAWRKRPRERSPAVRFGICVISVGALVALFVADRTLLPRLYRPFHDALAFSALLTAQAVALAIADLFPEFARGNFPRFGWLLVVLAIALPGVPSMNRLGHDQALTFVLLEHTGVPGRSVELLRWLADRDADGHAAILGGGDCNDGDARIHPGAIDLPENGKDEDCSGADLRLEDLRRVGSASAPLVQGRFDVLLITVDALRADHVGAYGYRRSTTPQLDRLASRSLLFQRAYAQSNNTAASIPALHTGRYPSTSPWSFGHEKSVGPGWGYLTDAPNVTVAELLRDAGHTTFMFAGRGPLLGLGLDQGFQTVRTQLEDQAEALIGHVESLGEKQRWFSWLHFDEPHAPYDVHPGFDFGSTDADRYDSEIAFVDSRIGRILDWLDRTGRAKSTIVVVTADHGEELGDHGGAQHASTLYEEQIRVPLIVAVPGVSARRVTEPAELIGVVPTLLSVLGIEIPSFIDGSSLFGLLASSEPARAYSEHYNGTVLRRALVTERWKLISNTAANTFELYDLDNDGTERENRIDQERALGDQLRGELDTLTQRRALLALGLARRNGGESVDALARMLPSLQQPDLVLECARVLADAAVARRDSPNGSEQVDGWASEISALLRRPELAGHVRSELARSLENMGGVGSLRGLIRLAGDADAEVARAGQSAVERMRKTAPHPYKWPARAESAPEVSHLDFGTRHGEWQVVLGAGRSERVGVRTTMWSSGDRTRLAFWIPTDTPRAGEWVLEAEGWAHPDAPERRVAIDVDVNGVRSGTLTFTTDLSRSELSLPAATLRSGANFVDFSYPWTRGPEHAAVRWSFVMLFPALPGAFDVLAGATATRVEWRGGWERLGLWRGVLFRQSVGPRVEVVVPLEPDAARYRLRFEASTLQGTAVVTASVNDRAVGRVEIGADWTHADLEIPRDALVKGGNRVLFNVAFPQGTPDPVLRWHAVNVSPW